MQYTTDANGCVAERARFLTLVLPGLCRKYQANVRDGMLPPIQHCPGFPVYRSMNLVAIEVQRATIALMRRDGVSDVITVEAEHQLACLLLRNKAKQGMET